MQCTAESNTPMHKPNTDVFLCWLQVDGVWVDKAYLVQNAAEQTGHALLWHKLVARVPPGVTTFGKPSYHHMLCFSRVGTVVESYHSIS
jgi:hypothetical protein